MYDQLRLDRPPVRAAAEKAAYGQEMKFATLNVRSIRKAGMHKQVERYMEDRNIAILCLQETKVALTTQYVVGDLTYVMHGHGGDQIEHAGVGMVIRKDLKPFVTGFTLDIGGRVMTVGLDLAPRMLTLVSAYMPHNSRTDLERAQYFELLEDVVAVAAKKGPVMVLGDLNARIHGRLRGEEDMIGPHTWGLGVGRLVRPEALNAVLTNRELLLTVCESNDMKVMNTWFKKPPARKVTYMSPGVERLPAPGQPWDPLDYAELDLCLVPDRWKGMVKDVESVTWASLNTDHFPLEVTVKLRLAAKAKDRGEGVPVKYQFTRLEEHVLEEYDRGVMTELAQGGAPDTVEGHWEVLSDAVKYSMKEHIPPAPKRAKRPWITAETMEVLEHRKCLMELGLVADARSLDKVVRARAKEDKKRWTEEGLKIKFWDPIKALIRQPARRAVAMKRNKKSGMEWGKPSEVFADYLEKEQWGRSESVEAPEAPEDRGPIWRGDAPPEVEQGDFTMEELNAALEALSKNKAPGPDQIPNEAWASLRGSRAALLAFFNRCWREEKFPEAWREAEVIAIFKKGDSADPSNYRPISLLQTAYKIMGKLLAKRLEQGLESYIRETQFGFRKGRSTAEPMFIIRRLQDLVHARKNQALHLIFLDWSKAFDKVEAGLIPHVLTRLGVPDKMIRVVAELIRDPEFKVRMGEGDRSDRKAQDTGIRQGCTLSPFLFTLVLTAIMHDVEARVREEHPMATTPAMPFMDLEYADDTALIAKTAEIATKLLRYTEEEAARYGLKINRKKTFRLAYNSGEGVTFADGQEVPRVEVLKYLGTIMSDRGWAEVEVKERTRSALARCKALRPIWAASNLTRVQALRVLKSCVFSALLYGLHTLYLTEGLERRLDALQVRCLRRAMGIRSTYASKLIGEEPLTNQKVAQIAQARPLSAELTKMRYQLLGHVLRRTGDDYMRAVSYDRFGQPMTLGGVNRHGGMRKCWAPEVMASAVQVLKEQGAIHPDSRNIQSGPGHPYAKVTHLAQDRTGWQAWVNRWYENQGWWNYATVAQEGGGGGAGRPPSPARTRSRL